METKDVIWYIDIECGNNVVTQWLLRGAERVWARSEIQTARAWPRAAQHKSIAFLTEQGFCLFLANKKSLPNWLWIGNADRVKD